MPTNRPSSLIIDSCDEDLIALESQLEMVTTKKNNNNNNNNNNIIQENNQQLQT